jgi:hypothetical protein
MITLQFKIDAEGIDLDKRGQAIVKAAQKGLRQLTQQAFEEWQNIAAQKLKTTRRVYQDSLSFTMVGSDVGEITLQARDPNTNFLVNALEDGLSPFSIRDAVLKKAKKHWPREKPMSAKQLRAMFAYLAKVGRLGLPPTEFTDVPFRTGSKEQGTPNAYRRISKNTPGGKWPHPGFKPKGGGGPGPLRPDVVKYVKATAADVFRPLMARVVV